MELEHLKDIVKDNTGIDVNRKTRLREVVEARNIYFHLCRNNTTKSLAEIGKSVQKDHATVLHGLKQIKNWTSYDHRLRQQLLDIESRIVYFKKQVQETGLSFETIVENYRDMEKQNKHLIQANKTLMGKIVSLQSRLKHLEGV
jgi:hypothetical protein